MNFGTLHEAGELRDVLAVIGKYSARTLKHLELRDNKNYFYGIEIIRKMSFPNVEELSFFMCGERIHYFNFSFKEAFPKVSRLAATFTKFAEPMWIDNSFSNLTHFQVHNARYFTDAEVYRILRNNPKIHSLSVVQATPQFLRDINDQFPNIVNLGIINLLPAWIFGRCSHEKCSTAGI